MQLELLGDVHMLLMIEKRIKGGICYKIHKYVKPNNKQMKNQDKNKESSYIQYLDGNNLYGWVKSQKLPVHDFVWIRNMLSFNKDFIKDYDKDSDKGYFLKQMLNALKHFIIFIVIFYSYQKEWKQINSISLYASCMTKITMLST